MKLKGKNVMVTGGAGFIGSHLVDRLIAEEPAKLIVVDNFFLGCEENLAAARAVLPELEIFRLDASDLAAMRQVVESEAIEVVFDLAVIPLPTSLKYPVWTIETNVGIASTFCELARWGCIKTLVHCGNPELVRSANLNPLDGRIRASYAGVLKTGMILAGEIEGNRHKSTLIINGEVVEAHASG